MDTCTNSYSRIRELAPLVASTQASATDYFARCGLAFENRTIPFCPLPLLISKTAFLTSEALFARLNVILAKIISLYHREPEVRAYFGLESDFHALVESESDLEECLRYCRYDYTLDARTGLPRVYEFNGHCPAGSSFIYYWQNFFAHCALRSEFPSASLVLPFESDCDYFARQLCQLVAPGSGFRVLNSRHDTLWNEVQLIAQSFARMGVSSRVAFLEDLRAQDTILWDGDTPVSLALAKFNFKSAETKDDKQIPPFGESWDGIAALVEACRSRKVALVNSFSAMFLIENKLAMALLSTSHFRSLFTAAELQVVDAIIPQTFSLATLTDRQYRDVLQNKERWLLKGVLETRGQSISFGRDTTKEDWQQLVDRRRKQEPHWYVLQEYTPTHRTPTEWEGQTCFLNTTLASFVVRQKTCGLLIRSSWDEITNVGQRGFIQPYLITET